MFKRMTETAFSALVANHASGRPMATSRRMFSRWWVLLGTIALALVVTPDLLMAAHLVYFDEDGGAGNPRGFYNFDTTTGISSLRAEVIGGGRFFSMARRPSDGAVFAISPNDHSLYSVDVNTGLHSVSTILAGPSNVISDLLNIAFDPTTSELFGIKRNGSGLYSIDQTTGQVALVGPVSGVRAGLAFAPNGILYATDTNTSNALYTIDTDSGVAALVGGGGTTSLEDATFTSNGEMFVTGFNGGVFQYNLTTGSKATVGSTGMGSGLLGVIAVPEPSSSVIALVGIAGLLGAIARRRWRSSL